MIIIEKAKNNYSAYSPDLPGCVATGVTPNEVRTNMLEAIILHIDGLKEDNLPIPIYICKITWRVYVWSSICNRRKRP
jgi:predicted RNase H-like HicB family nuclease